MAEFKDKEEFFDGLFEHLFSEDTPNDDDQEWFETKVMPFFDQFPGFAESGQEGQGQDASSARRRRSGQAGNSGGVSGPRRKRRQQTNSSGYGSNVFFGGN